MIERVIDLEKEKIQLQLALKRIGVDVPVHAERLASPRKWLIRGETNKQRLVRGLPFEPQSGQMGTRGVFLGDCLSSLMYPQVGAYYVFDRDDLSQDWLCAPSEEFDAQAEKIAAAEHINAATISGGVELENKMYSLFSIYQSNAGICTIPYTIPLDVAHAILITPGFIESSQVNDLPEEIRRKIVWLR